MRVWFVAILLYCSLRLIAQSQSGMIVGTVSDQAGAILPGAPVELRNEGTRVGEQNGVGQVAFRNSIPSDAMRPILGVATGPPYDERTAGFS